MKRSFSVVVAATLLAAPALAQTMPPAISVTGEATVSVAPDQAQIDGGVTSDAKTAREASEANKPRWARYCWRSRAPASTKRTTRPRGCRCSRNLRRTRPPIVPQASSASAPATGSRSKSATSPGRQRHRRAGRRRRQRNRRHQFHGNAVLKASRRGPRKSDRRCTPQGGDLRQGRRRDARRTHQHFRGRRANADVSRQDGGPMAAGAPVAQAKRRCR